MVISSSEGTGSLLYNITEYYLSLYLFDTARFYAERCYYDKPDEKNLNLWAQTYFRQGKIKQTYLILKGSKSSENRYLFAHCCIALDKLNEAEQCLLSSNEQDRKNNNDEIPGGALGLYLMGFICRRSNRRELAIDYFKRSLQLDSTLWSSIVQLGELGEIFDPSKLFGISMDTAISILNLPLETQTNNFENIEKVLKSKMVSKTNWVFNNSFINSTSDYNSNNNNNNNNNENDNENEKDSLNTLPEIRRYVTSLAEKNVLTSSTPRTAISLGMSSLSLRIPFASPGSTPNQSPMNQNPFQTARAARNNIYNSNSTTARNASLGDQSMGSSISFLSPRGILFTSPAGDFNNSNTGYSQIIPNSNNETVNTQAQSSLIGGNIPPNSSFAKHDTSNYFSEGPSILSPVKGSAFKATAVGLGLDKKLNESGIFGMNNRVSFSGADLDEEGFSRQESLVRGRLSFSSANVSSIHDYQDPDFMNHSGIHNNNNTKNNSLLNNSNIANEYSNKDKYTDEEMCQESPQKVPRKGPTPDILKKTKSSMVTRSKIKDAFESSGLSANIMPIESQKEDTQESQLDAQECELIKVSAITSFFASALLEASAYRCKECIEMLHKLPSNHFKSGWVQHLLGKCYFEMCEYKSSLLSLKEMMVLEPFRTDGMDILSTTLWHLKKEKQLCALAQQAVEVDKMSPQVWCVVGNCFSLQKETETSIKFFQRALQIDPSFTYAHTLCGHELMSNEDLDKALTSFRNALKYDDRHYNAWYGLGAIYFRQEKYDLAEYHFRKAISINSSSSVLQCYLGMVLHTQAQHLEEINPQDTSRDKKTKEALDVLTRACKIDPNNPQLRFQRVHVLLSIGKQEEALKDLEIVRDLAPREPPVYSLLGQLYHRMGKINEAIQNFNVAMDLDPKGEATAMKAVLEEIYKSNDNNESNHSDIRESEEDVIEPSLTNRSIGRVRLNMDSIYSNDRYDEDDGMQEYLEEDEDEYDLDEQQLDEEGEEEEEEEEEEEQLDEGEESMNIGQYDINEDLYYEEDDVEHVGYSDNDGFDYGNQ